MDKVKITDRDDLSNIPATPRGLRAWLFLRHLRVLDVADTYGCRPEFIVMVLSGKKRTTEHTWQNVRRAAARAYQKKRRRSTGAPAHSPHPAQGEAYVS